MWMRSVRWIGSWVAWDGSTTLGGIGMLCQNCHERSMCGSSMVHGPAPESTTSTTTHQTGLVDASRMSWTRTDRDLRPPRIPDANRTVIPNANRNGNEIRREHEHADSDREVRRGRDSQRLSPEQVRDRVLSAESV